MGESLSTYSEAVQLLMERFPGLGLAAGTWERREPVNETVPLPNIENIEALYFYGLHSSIYAHCKEWLRQSPKRQLIFLEDDPSLIASFLHRSEAIEILSDPQVHLELFSKKTEEIEALAQRFPLQRIEVAALQSKKGLSPLRLKFLRKTALAHALHIDRLHGYQPFRHFIENIRRLPRSFYANGLKGAFTGMPAIVCGAGPSLQSSIEQLRPLVDQALIIAGGSTLAALSSQGIVPHFGMALDPNLEEYRRLKNSFAFEMPLLYSTRVHPSIFQTCNGPFGYMRSGIGGAPELWLEEELGLLGPLMGDFLSPEAISVTAICVAWAQFLGCNPILINGVDMAYTGNRRYASGVSQEKEVAWKEIDAEKSAADRIIRRKNRSGESVLSAVRWIMESASLSDFAKKHKKIRFINTTDGGIGFRGIDYVPLSEAAKGFEQRDIWKLVREAIDRNPMPAGTDKKIGEAIRELRGSLDRVVGHLEVLSGTKRGSTALAEIELKEEIAYCALFYDVYQLYKPGDEFWKSWLQLALKYQEAVD